MYYIGKNLPGHDFTIHSSTSTYLPRQEALGSPLSVTQVRVRDLEPIPQGDEQGVTSDHRVQ